ncbi:hypothetical protein [Pseudoalteromonas sp. T1lg10]|uniref:hypothetical protein n=1 Tax=Pseudoalteromonas sp. T1lg10 TaxID=2077093 RepID=UPI000CF7105E|nr:hypothetical protein [Pseudoalteromonas sp. T1lg10]
MASEIQWSMVINPRHPRYQEKDVSDRRKVKEKDKEQLRIRRDIEAYHEQRAIDRSHGLDHLLED